MKEKRCARCKKTLPLETFRLRNARPGQYFSYCKPCDRAISKEHYEKNKKYYMDKNRNRRAMLTDWLTEYKSTHPCQECGESRHYVLVFHHRDKTEKDDNISVMVMDGISIARIKEEIAKCDSLCANCHRELHWRERNNSG